MTTVSTPLIDRTSLLVAVGLVVGVVVSDQVFYRFLIVPRLGEWQSVPLHQWLIVSLPAVLAGLIGGAYLSRGQRLVVAPLNRDSGLFVPRGGAAVARPWQEPRA
jgi:hypothetical protein